MAGQLTLGLFEDIKTAQDKTTVITDAPVKANVYALSDIQSIIARCILMSELPGLYPPDFISQVIEVETRTSDTFTPSKFPFDIKGDPNEALWLEIKEGKVDREKIFSEYLSLGQTVTIDGDRGLPDLAKKRALTLQQFFTPSIITRFLAQALRLDIPGTPASVVDNSCGIGRMFKFLNNDCDLVGIEVEDKAYHMARTLFPKAHIIQDDMVNHPRAIADYFIINPPFSIQLEKKNCGFKNAGWGALGPGASIKSHIAAMETAIESARYFVAAMLPMGYFTNEDTFAFEKWVNSNAKLVYRLDIEGKAFTKFGFTWPCSVVIYSTDNLDIPGTLYHKTDTLDEAFLARELAILQLSETGRIIREATEHIKKRGHIHHAIPEKAKIAQILEPVAKLPLTGTNTVKICLSPDASCLNLKVDNVLAALKVDEFREAMGKEWNQGLSGHTSIADVKLRRKNLLEDPRALYEIWESISRTNLIPIIDTQYANWVVKKARWYKRQQAPFEQFIKGKDGAWECLHEDDGIKTLYPELYQARLKQLDKLGIKWLWPFQREDVARMSLKNTTLLADQMGLGKTRQIIALGLLYGCKYNLIIVEPKLKDEFVKEFKTIGITDYQIITEEKHLKNLKKFNIMAYNLLWRPLNDRTKKTFAKAMRRRFQFIAIDEAHKIKAKDSEQAKAVRMLKARYKLLSTGTPIANYPRNIFSLLVFGWGDATELNRYGYYSPIEKEDERGYRSGYTTGTRQFKEDFVSIEWVTERFAQTLDSGAKSREIPKIKNPEKWWAMMCSKIIRRQRDEPGVKAHITFPKPEISTELIKMSPNHIKHYKHWLDNFASWFKDQLRMEKEDGHKIDQMMVLAHLTKLQFASTIPQSPQTDTKDAPWTYGQTTKQERTIELVKEAIANGEKIIVFSERPEFQKFMQEVLRTKHGIKSHLFIGQQGIKERNILLDDFRNNGTNVLLATTSCGETGLNIHEANKVVLADTSWTPSKQIQAYSRILRPQQKKTPKIFLLRAIGTIDEYMSQLMAAKSEAIDEGIDYQEAAAFDAGKWLSYKDFTIKMLREERYNI
ncbi:MAG: SNF2-related protein [Candidatus Methanoperedens sp.]